MSVPVSSWIALDFNPKIDPANHTKPHEGGFFVQTMMPMRHLFICTLLCTLAIPALAQTTRSISQPRQAKRSDHPVNSALVRDWATDAA